MSNALKLVANRKPAWYFRFSTWMAIFGVMIATIVLTFTWREVAAARELNQLNHGRSRESLAAWYQSHTSTEGTVEWGEILTLTSSQLIRYRMELFESESVDPPFPMRSPEYYIHLKQFLLEVKPLIERIRAAGTLMTPVWIPIQFDEYWDRFYASRSVLKLVALECESAVHERDSSTALRSLETMQNCVDAFDWNLGWMSTTISMSHRHTLYDSLQNSLEVDLWDETHMVSLKEYVRPLDVNEVWQKMLDVGRGEFAELPRGMADYVRLPSVRKQIFDQLQQVRGLAKDGYRGLSERSKRRVTEAATSYWCSNPQYQYREMAAAFVQLEDHRRLTMAAIELKRFSLAKSRLPTDLRELDQFAHGGVELETCEGKRFMYEVDNDSKAATLWCRIFEGTERASQMVDALIKGTPGLSYSVTVQ